MGSSREQSKAVSAQIAQKDDLIAALTSQLEKAVEQLDRLKRSGADRLGSGHSSAHEAARQQEELSGKLESALAEWSELQPTDRILKIENGIDQILAILARGEPVRSRIAMESAPTAPAPKAAPAKATGGDESFWEAAKARLMREAGVEEPPPAPAIVEQTPDPAQETVIIDQQKITDVEIPIPEAPHPISAEADKTQLWQAIESRDLHIQFLTSRLRNAESNRNPFPDWDVLVNVPEELKIRLTALEATLREQLRQAEIANSLERATLTRERARLTQIKQQLEGHIRKMGLTPAGLADAAAAQKNPPEPPTKEPEQDRRWTRLFQR
ncbi:hypothetical protein [Planctomicrobium sp. SH664]|uniref:hypothetical protein n=1 Tax=Planctomicrobium sp. SH664 TaxID=3448125 RepID=UPI003F5B4FF4